MPFLCHWNKVLISNDCVRGRRLIGAGDDHGLAVAIQIAAIMSSLLHDYPGGMNKGNVADNESCIAGHFFKSSQDGWITDDEHGEGAFF